MCNSVDNSSVVSVCRQFELVCEDLENALCSQVNGIVEKLQKPGYASDSSGLEGNDCDRWELLEDDRARERVSAQATNYVESDYIKEHQKLCHQLPLTFNIRPTCTGRPS